MPPNVPSLYFDSCASHLSMDVNELREKNSLQLLPPQLAQHLLNTPWMFLYFWANEGKAEGVTDIPPSKRKEVSQMKRLHFCDVFRGCVSTKNVARGFRIKELVLLNMNALPYVVS